MLAEAIVGHLVGDYLLQNDWMALNKKNKLWICLIHATIWTSCVFLFSGMTIGLVGLAILFLTHIIQDHTLLIQHYMKFVGQEKFMKDLYPWAGIVVDNVWHIVIIFWVIKYGL